MLDAFYCFHLFKDNEKKNLRTIYVVTIDGLATECALKRKQSCFSGDMYLVVEHLMILMFLC